MSRLPLMTHGLEALPGVGGTCLPADILQEWGPIQMLKSEYKPSPLDPTPILREVP